MTKNELQLLVSTYCTVGLLGFQSQSVIHGEYHIVGFTSFLIAFAQYFMIKGAANDRWHAAIYMGLGGAAGIMTSMLVFRHLFLHVPLS